jgi:hypothetical protein
LFCRLDTAKHHLNVFFLPLFFIKTAAFAKKNLVFSHENRQYSSAKNTATVPSGFPLGLMKESRQEFRQ